ncbi:30S ribosomal protein S6 [Candidatus Saccharibacteria bacterium]|nr:MAG: 30S ribosomal protein S6 [Candidatus Saccharibacteria bacterium]
MKEYELTVLIRPELEAKIDAPLEKVRAIIAQSGGKITKEDNWGKKRLAYTIRKEDFAVYVYFELQLPVDAPQKISNTLNITDDVLRYLLVTVNEKGRALLAESQKRADDDENSDAQE